MGGTGPAFGRALVDSLVDDLIAESATLRQVLDGLPAADWARATPAAGWTVTDQISHLAYFDDVAVQSAVRARRGSGAELEKIEAAGGIDSPTRVAARGAPRPVRRRDARLGRRRPRPAGSAAFRPARPVDAGAVVPARR